MDEAFLRYRSIIKEASVEYSNDFKQIYQQLEDSHAYYKGDVIPFLYQPFFFGQSEEDSFRYITEKLSSILEKVIQEYVTNAEFRAHFNFSSQLEELILVNPGYENNFPMARFDVFYYAPQDIKFCELNADGSSGMVKGNILEDHFKDAAAVNELKKEYQIENWDLVNSWLEAMFESYYQFKDSKEQPNIAIMDFNNYGMVGEFEYFKELLVDRGYRIKIVDPRELEYRNSSLYSDDFKIDLIYRRAVTKDLMDHYQQLDDLWQAYKNHDVCLVGSMRSQIIHNKIIFAILHDREKVSFLTAEEQQFIADYIPSTEVVDTQSEKLLDKIILQQKQLVLKPVDDYGGHGVLIGRDMNSAEWEKEVHRIWKEREDYLAQQFCPLPEKELVEFNNENLEFSSYKYILGLFTYNQSFKGVYTRADKQNVIASSAGCVTLPNFKVQKRL